MKKTDYLVILAPMVNELGLQGNSLLVFAMIHGFSKDGSHKFVGSFQYIADWLNVSIRSAKEIVSLLVHDGYVTKMQERDDHNRPINVYASNYEELLAKVAAGVEVKPSSIKGRRGSKKVNGAQCAPIITTDGIGAQSDISSVHKLPFNGAQCAPNKDIYTIDIDNNSLSESARARKEEEREFFKIFFLKNAADPAAETTRFVGFYQSREWTAKDGTQYDTPAKRAGLALAWDCKSGDRLSKSAKTDAFYEFIGELYDFAQKAGGLDARMLLDTKGGYRIEGNTFTFIGYREVSAWIEQHASIIRPLLDKHFGTGLHWSFIAHAS